MSGSSSPSPSGSSPGAALNQKLHEALPASVADKIHVPETKGELKGELKTEAKAAASATFAQLRSLAAGGFGGVCAVVVGHPFDLVKVRMQTAEKGVYSGAIDVVRKGIARDGLRRGLYAGVSAPLVGVTPMCESPSSQVSFLPVSFFSWSSVLIFLRPHFANSIPATQSPSPSGATTLARTSCAACPRSRPTARSRSARSRRPASSRRCP